MLKSKVLMNYFAILDYVQHSSRSVEMLDTISLVANGKCANSTIEEFEDLPTMDYSIGQLL